METKQKPGTKVTTCETCHGSGKVTQTVSTILGQMQTTKTCPEWVVEKVQK